MELLSSDEIQLRIAEREHSIAPRWVKSLRSVGESLIEALQVEDGINLGLTSVDVLTRGFRPTDLVIVTGFAHSGKTQLVNTMILNNPDRRVLFFSVDDAAEMILAKLVAMQSGVSAERIESRIRDGDAETQRLVLEVAVEVFPNLCVIDDVIGIGEMQEAVAEATALWGAPPHAVVIDYVEMMPSTGFSADQGQQVKHKLTALKGWAKVAPFPIIALHQGTRSNAHPGDPITLLSMGFSGEQQATLVLGCRRKKDKLELDPWERQHHAETITVHVVKNKRAGGKCTHPDGLDFHMESSTGKITPLRDPLVLTAAEMLVPR